jgi:hypothetical protein
MLKSECLWNKLVQYWSLPYAAAEASSSVAKRSRLKTASIVRLGCKLGLISSFRVDWGKRPCIVSFRTFSPANEPTNTSPQPLSVVLLSQLCH